MQSHHHSQPIPSSPSKSPVFRPYKTHLDLTFKRSTSLFNDHIEDEQNTSSFSKSLKLRKKLRSSSDIQSLTLAFYQIDSRFRRIGSKKVSADFLKEFPNLQSLKMTHVSFAKFSVLLKAIKSLRELKSLEINFEETVYIYKRKCIQDFIKAVSPRLKQLTLNYPDIFTVDMRRRDESRYHLRIWRLNRLIHLQKLAMNLPIPSYLKTSPDSTIKDVDLSPMKGLNRLQRLDITLAQHSTDENPQINTKKLSFDPNKLFPNLRKFTWGVIGTTHLPIKGIELIGPQIASKLKHLDDFGLKIRHYGIKVDFIELSQCLATLQTKLNFLQFAYNGGELSEKDVKTLFSALSLQRLKSLHTLSLEFPSCKGITNEFLADLAQACGKNFPGLRSLRLIFGSFQDEQGSKIPSLLKALFGIEGISDRGITNLGEVLSKGCQNLEFLSLKFQKYLQVSDKGAKSLCKQLDKLKGLKTVRIKFEDCVSVTYMGCEEAAKLLGSHRQVLVSEWRRNTSLF